MASPRPWASLLNFMLVADLAAASLAFSSGHGGVLRLQDITFVSSQRLPESRSPPMKRVKEVLDVSLMR